MAVRPFGTGEILASAQRQFSLLKETLSKWSNKDIYDPTECNQY